MILWVDFETRSRCDLPALCRAAVQYASTELIKTLFWSTRQ